ncbi:LacI family DNA-binding transcriptional regulator [Candidatus Aerophobetes bacterium]|nr:LacI family DNA-binding transcriptional regulator [Candidatus Aerophobetes bacterium]
MAVTIKEIAKIANVSVCTVSRVINNTYPEKVSKGTRLRVLKVMKDLGYRPSIIARGLAKKKTSLLGLIVRDIMSSFYPEIIEGIEDEAKKFDYSLILCTTKGNPKEEAKYLRLLREKRVDGIILTPVINEQANIKLFEELKRDKIPLVFIAYYLKEFKGLYVVVDHKLGGYMATKHLIELGHKRIGYLGKENDIVGKERAKGYKQALFEYNIEFNKELIIKSGYSWKDGYYSMKRFLKTKNNRPTAIFAICDMTAWGAMQAIRQEGLKVPEDIAIVGFDDLGISSLMEVPLTTIAQPKYEMGKVAVTKLIKKIEHKNARGTILKPKLVIRKSSGDRRAF